MKSDWSIYVEGNGSTHNCDLCDASVHALNLVKALEAAGHRLYQIRFTCASGEENWREPSLRDMHEEMVEKAYAARVQSADALGVRQPEQKDEGRKSGEGVHPSDTKESFRLSAGKKSK